jgi:hypothetical protein
MRLASVLLLFACPFPGCASHPRSDSACTWDHAGEWTRLSNPPKEEAKLRALLNQDGPGGKFMSRRAPLHSSLFSSPDGTRLLYCYRPEYPSHCNGLRTTFTRQGAAWSKNQDGVGTVCSS